MTRNLWMFSRIVVIGLSVAVIGACERPKAPVNGIGGFQLGKSKLSGLQGAASARCFDTKGKARCLILARQAIAGRTPQTQLEFAGNQPESTLERIVMEIPGCNIGEVRAWFEKRLGDVSMESDKGVLWQQKYMVLSLYISGPSRCQVLAVEPSNESAIAEVVAPYAPRTPTAPAKQ